MGSSNLIRTATLLALASFTMAAVPERRAWGSYGGGGYGGSGGSGNPFGNGGGGSGSGSSSGFFGQGGFASFLGFDIQQAMYLRSIHGILAAVAFVAVFPLGAVVMRVVPGRFTVYAHAIIQVVGFLMYIAAAAIGIYLVRMINIRGTSLLEIASINFHPIIGLVVLAALVFQPLLGIIHHMRFKKLRRRQVWSHLHLWVGRLFITLGIINGGLGLMVAQASDSLKIAYAVVAAVVWLVWMLVAVMGEARRARAAAAAPRKAKLHRVGS